MCQKNNKNQTKEEKLKMNLKFDKFTQKGIEPDSAFYQVHRKEEFKKFTLYSNILEIKHNRVKFCVYNRLTGEYKVIINDEIEIIFHEYHLDLNLYNFFNFFESDRNATDLEVEFLTKTGKIFAFYICLVSPIDSKHINLFLSHRQ
ncbi:hypothetical protein BpHYR1_053476 [Brachionus plicatilis]|uniref:Uncharacterized protein n=1 Tax=Brachionus plicatilis TaxID=10195 RepID=A0A3M7Q7C2_BRAPC|nr:hypothetical protein BpHYR1_053476 [Brachionus plicatilis]